MNREDQVLRIACHAVARLCEIVATMPAPSPKAGKPSPRDLILKDTSAKDARLVEELLAMAPRLTRCAEIAQECHDDDFPLFEETAAEATQLLYEAARVSSELLRQRTRGVAEIAKAG